MVSQKLKYAGEGPRMFFEMKLITRTPETNDSLQVCFIVNIC